MRTTLFLSLLIILASVSLLHAKPLEAVSLQLQWRHQFQFAGYYMAKAKGFYQEAGLDVEIKEMNDTRDITGDVLEGHSEYGIGSSDLLIDRAKGRDVVLLAAIFQSSPIVVLAREDLNISSVDELADKRLEGGSDIINSASVRTMIGEYRPIEVRGTNTNDAVKDLAEDKADAIVAYRSNELYSLMQTGIAYKLFSPKDYGWDEHSDLLFTSEKEVKSHPERAIAMRKASIRGWEYAFEHIDETVELIMRDYNTQEKSRDALLFEAYTLRELAYYKTRQIGTIDLPKLDQTYSAYRRAGLIADELDLDDIVLNVTSHGIDLSEKEHAYLASKQELVVCTVGDRLPYLGSEGDNIFGIIRDFYRVFERSIGIEMRFVLEKDTQACARRVAKGDADMLALIATSPNRYHGLIPSKAFGEDDIVVVSRIDAPYIHRLDSYKGRVGIVAPYKNLSAYIRDKYPRLELVDISSTKEGFKRVADGRLDAFIDMYLISTFAINNDHVGELKINTVVKDLRVLGAAGVPSDDDILLGILNKAIDAFSTEERMKIVNSWVRTQRIAKPDYLLLGELSLLALLIILGLLYRQRFLQRHNDLLIDANRSIKEQQEKIKEQKQIYELVFDNTTDGLLIIEDGVFIDCNDAIIKILHGTTREDILLKSPETFSPTFQPDGMRSDEKSAAMIALAIEEGGHRFEWMNTRLNGEEFWSEITMTPFMVKEKRLIYVVWRDKSENLELELQNSYLKERIELAFDGSQDGLWDWNLIDDTVYLSPRWKAMLGYEDRELPNELETWKSRVHPDDLEQALDDLKMTIEGRNDRMENKHRLRHKDGRWIWVYDRGKVQTDIHGKAIRLIGTHTDLSAEINLSNRLTQLNKDLEARVQYEVSQNLKKEELLMHHARLAQMGEMLSMIAHQWRQPLSAISAAVGTLQLNTMLEQYDKASFSTRLGNISDYAQHLSQTINDFRDFFKTHKLMEETSLEEIIDNTMRIVLPSLEEKKIKVEFDLTANVRFNTYVNEFRQVVLNLIKNAEDALVENAISGPKIIIKTFANKKLCTLQVHDNAGGIPADKLTKVFDLYFTTKEKDGTGLGLYMSKVIIEEHCKGTLRVHNGKSGAIFTIKVPR